MRRKMWRSLLILLLLLVLVVSLVGSSTAPARSPG